MSPIEEIRSWQPTDTHLAPSEATIRNAGIILNLLNPSDVRVSRRTNGTINIVVTDNLKNVVTLSIDEFSVRTT